MTGGTPMTKRKPPNGINLNINQPFLGLATEFFYHPLPYLFPITIAASNLRRDAQDGHGANAPPAAVEVRQLAGGGQLHRVFIQWIPGALGFPPLWEPGSLVEPCGAMGPQIYHWRQNDSSP